MAGAAHHEGARSSAHITRLHLLVFGLILTALIAIHVPYLSLPYFWDELGQFIPAALDILRDGAWVPHSTVPNVHPPGVMAYLAVVWRLFGYSQIATRVAMLGIAAAGVYVTFLLCIRMCRRVPGVPAFIVVGLLSFTPLFYMQAMMAQLDMPAMTLTVLSLLLFLDGRYKWCVAACTALVLVKETGILLPAFFAGWLAFRDRNWKAAVYFGVPAVALVAWLAVLWRSTGHILGDPGFAHYNVGYQLNPIRLFATLLRRLYFLFVADFRWIGSIAILFGFLNTRFFMTWEWAVAASIFCGHVLLVSAFGGAALERYLLPAFPLLYIAMATGWAGMRPRTRHIAEAVMLAGMFTGLYWNPPFPFPLENNLAMVDFVELQKAASEYIDRHVSSATIASAWPYTGGLRNPDLGFTRRGYRIVETSDFHARNVIAACTQIPPDILVMYSRTWEPHWGVLSSRAVEQFLRKYYDWEPQITSLEVQSRLGLRPVLRWEQRGQWVEVFSR